MTSDGRAEVLVERDGMIATVTLSHPGRLNALTVAMWRALARAMNALSADERLVALQVMEDGDVLHASVRSLDVVTGESLAELKDEGLEVEGFGFSPVPGDDRVTVSLERTGEHRPAIWNARTGELTVLDNQINQGTATLRLKAVFANPRNQLWPNQFIKARLLLTVQRDALVVPAVSDAVETTPTTSPRSLTTALPEVPATTGGLVSKDKVGKFSPHCVASPDIHSALSV